MTSPDGEYKIVFQAVGEPDWPFGPSHARIVLKHNGDTVAKRRYDVANDGGVLHPDTDHLFEHEVTMKTETDGSFQYLANRIVWRGENELPSPQAQMEVQPNG